MNKKIAYLGRIFSVLSILFFFITIVLLIINCFMDTTFELGFSFLFSFIFFLNQIIFLPGSYKVNKREYKNSKLQSLQFYTAMAILAILLAGTYIKLSDNVDLCVHGSLLLLFLSFYSLQNFDYSFNFDLNKKIHYGRRVVLSVFLSSSLLVFLLYSLVHFFRG